MTVRYAGNKWIDGTVHPYTTITSACLASVSPGDIVYVECYNAARSLEWLMGDTALYAGVTVEQSPNIPVPFGVTIIATIWGFAYRDGAVVRGMRLRGASSFDGDHNVGTPTITYDSCIIGGAVFHYPSYGGKANFINCRISCPTFCTNLSAERTVTADNCTFQYMNAARAVVANARYRNCLVICPGAPGTPEAGTDNNRGTCTTFGTNFSAITAHEHLPVADLFGLSDHRLRPESGYVTGAADIGLTSDIDGNAYVGGFPFGCSSGVPKMANVLRLLAADGTYVPAAAGDVRKDTAIGQTVGSLAVPATNKVLLLEPVDNTTGSFDKNAYAELFEESRNFGASPSILKLGSTVVQRGVEIDGEYNPIANPPATPEMLIEDRGDGTGFELSAECDDVSINAVHIRSTASENWTLVDDEIAGSFDDLAVAAAPGIWFVRITSEGPGGVNCAVEIATVTDAAIARTMNASRETQIVRSIEKHFSDAFTGTRIIHGGMREDRARLTEWVEIHVSGPRWTGGRRRARVGGITVDVAIFAKPSTNPYRVHEISGSVSAALDRALIEVKSYPDANPVSVGWIRLDDPQSVPMGDPHTDGSGEVPVMQVNVNVEGRVELQA